MSEIRRPSVAGSWYPNDAAALAGAVDEYVRDADVDPIPSHLRALIAPHAGLMYSGPVAAFAYKAARDSRYGTIVLVGPSHFVPLVIGRQTRETAHALGDALARAIAARTPSYVDPVPGGGADSNAGGRVAAHAHRGRSGRSSAKCRLRVIRFRGGLFCGCVCAPTPA